MRLCDILSDPTSGIYRPVEGFLGNQKLKAGQSKKISIGKVRLTYFCKICNNLSVFYSNEELFCIGVDDSTVSIDCILTCPGCNTSIQSWFLIESNSTIFSNVPEVRVKKHSHKLNENVEITKSNFGVFSEWLEQAKRASHDGYGAGSIIYLRKALEHVTNQVGATIPISRQYSDGKWKTFKKYLSEVDAQSHIIPNEFSDDGYRLFGELSDVVHGQYDEEMALAKFGAFYRLVIGVLENVKNKEEFAEAKAALGWSNGGEEVE